MLKTRKSNPDKPVRVMVYAGEGLGKSTFGALSDKPIFISPEGGNDQLKTFKGEPVDECIVPSGFLTKVLNEDTGEYEEIDLGKNVENWNDLKRSIQDLIKDEHNFKTLVLDSADWIEGLCHRSIIGTSGKTITTALGGYGAGYRMAQNMHQELIADLTELREKRGMNIIVTAHAHVKPVKDPEMSEDYDAFEIKCHEYVSSLWREWVDALFFIRFATYVKADDTQKARAFSDGKRILYTVKRPAFQAKNRYGMPEAMEYTLNFWNEFMQYAKMGVVQESADQIKADMVEYFNLIEDASLRKTISESITAAKQNIETLNQIRSRLKEITTKKGA